MHGLFITCRKCGVEKPRMDYPKVGGYQCRQCLAKKMKEWRANPKNKTFIAARRIREKPVLRACTKRWMSSNPEKAYAHKMVWRAVKSGKLIKPLICETCERPHKVIQGHHDDYTKPLSVRWLCPFCHRQWHADQERLAAEAAARQ